MIKEITVQELNPEIFIKEKVKEDWLKGEGK